ncbi:hypothetical protein NEUTE1DRAFT_143574 [Neurospora tetrasperma FGSC 2508]|uniref:Uncharacterized protein n=1 Tax=Neurospora tetrasperma (strain FGSC 2508 / ATCC MYA-4615 / P0657) TaxID=510951 RepID=F8MER0_NEUT8|nr:uncharacterized protein NEUTE1DRAFT_143574 [Neurospora tetrasperma FGSC 2508]EGO60032.1 hypothetical protein NEUTE1DRAFT_143574 [Neurospora tetrasperma FGSC 2508]
MAGSRASLMEWTVDDGTDNEAAFNGQNIPHSLSSKVTQWCLIRGIRHHPGFATELHGAPELPSITRALNARAIMSSKVPQMEKEEEFPYCFWHPDLPSEQTLRQLLARYGETRPTIQYQVGRVCAMAGYTALYDELHLLPEVAIAEEARDSSAPGSKAIYESIMRQPARYSIMDDYALKIRTEDPRPVAFLMGNTCTRQTLVNYPMPAGNLFNPHTIPAPIFDITEDRNLSFDKNALRPSQIPVSEDTLRLLYAPLPLNLPSHAASMADKNLLILMAAWSSNIERYSRLRRPGVVIPGELQCIVRGIYHSVFFAKWWASPEQLKVQKQLGINLMPFIHARFVMHNDLSWIKEDTPEEDMPTIMWVPDHAEQSTYLAMARMRPTERTKFRCARALIAIGDYEGYEKLGTGPDRTQYWEAQSRQCKEEASGFEGVGKKFLEDIEKKAKEKWGTRNINERPDDPDHLYVAEWHYELTNMAENEVEDEWNLVWLTHMLDVGDKPPRSINLYRQVKTEMTGFDELSNGTYIRAMTEEEYEDWFAQADHYADPRQPNDFNQDCGVQGILLRVAAMDEVKRMVSEGFEWRNLSQMYRNWDHVPEDEREYLGVYPRKEKWGMKYLRRKLVRGRSGKMVWAGVW